MSDVSRTYGTVYLQLDRVFPGINPCFRIQLVDTNMPGQSFYRIKFGYKGRDEPSSTWRSHHEQFTGDQTVDVPACDSGDGSKHLSWLLHGYLAAVHTNTAGNTHNAYPLMQDIVNDVLAHSSFSQRAGEALHRLHDEQAYQGINVFRLTSHATDPAGLILHTLAKGGATPVTVSADGQHVSAIFANGEEYDLRITHVP